MMAKTKSNKTVEAAQEARVAELAKEETVSMTILVPVSIHTRMKVAAAERHVGLYQMIVEHFDESY